MNTMRAKEFEPKPRNFVAKNAKMGGAGAHKDKKKAEKQGDLKHKKSLVPMESVLRDKEDLQAKRKALQDLSMNKDVDQKVVQQRKLDLEKEAKQKSVEEGLKGNIAAAALAAANLLGNPAQAAEEPVKPITIAYVTIDGEVRKYNLGDKFTNSKEAEQFISSVLDKKGLSGYTLDIKHGYPKKKDMTEAGYQHGFADPKAPDLGSQDKRDFKRAELQHELGNERNNIAVSINGKLWKVFRGKGTADSFEERQYLNHMRSWAEKKSAASGKKWSVGLTGAEPTA